MTLEQLAIEETLLRGLRLTTTRRLLALQRGDCLAADAFAQELRHTRRQLAAGYADYYARTLSAA